MQFWFAKIDGGYSTEMLGLICNVSRKSGLKELQLSVEKDNAASVKTILKNGGTYSRCFVYEGKEAVVYHISV